jgi:threonine/homoserine/homoserine lactone efflux protein
MDVLVVLRGFVLGFSIAAVLGPIGVLCIRRTLASGFLNGLLSGLGAATADAAYASIAAFGVTAVATTLVHQRTWLRLVGGAFLVYLGVRTVRSAPARTSAGENGTRPLGLLTAYVSTLALTLSNPTTVLSFVGLFAGLGLGAVDDALAGVGLVLGVFVCSAAWWLLLAGLVSRLRARLTPSIFRAINVASGLLILAFGAQALASLRA